MANIYPSITTTPKSDWQRKIKEISKLNLIEVCLFLTCLEKKERQKLYELLAKTPIKKIPLVHIRNDMDREELAFLKEKYAVQAFNTHSQKEYPFLYDISEFKNQLYLENTRTPFDQEELKKDFAGICLDLSHLEIYSFTKPEIFQENKKIIEESVCGCNHISSDRQNPHRHFYQNLSEFDYLKKYPAEYFSPILALELENSIEEQLKVREYIINLLAIDKRSL